MLLNWFEKALMNNPVRAAIQRGYEAGRLLKMGGPVTGGVALEIGCGRGVGVEIIFDRFHAQRVEAFDLDPDMVERARKRLASRTEHVRLWTGDATSIPSDDGAYDAVFDFYILHHVPDWQKALSEVARVLKPGGRLYAEEGLRRLVLNPVCRLLTAHPLDNCFDSAEFCNALKSFGFDLVAVRQFWEYAGWFVAEKRR